MDEDWLGTNSQVGHVYELESMNVIIECVDFTPHRDYATCEYNFVHRSASLDYGLLLKVSFELWQVESTKRIVMYIKLNPYECDILIEIDKHNER